MSCKLIVVFLQTHFISPFILGVNLLSYNSHAGGSCSRVKIMLANQITDFFLREGFAYCEGHLRQ